MDTGDCESIGTLLIPSSGRKHHWRRSGLHYLISFVNLSLLNRVLNCGLSLPYLVCLSQRVGRSLFPFPFPNPYGENQLQISLFPTTVSPLYHYNLYDLNYYVPLHWRAQPQWGQMAGSGTWRVKVMFIVHSLSYVNPEWHSGKQKGALMEK